MANGDFAGSAFRNGRRTCLPAPCPDTTNINLWNILRNNIGKDLSKVSMPVELNEPLNTLQRMCEEMEYSELLDKAAESEDPFERMVKKPSDMSSVPSQMLMRLGLRNYIEHCDHFLLVKKAIGCVFLDVSTVNSTTEDSQVDFQAQIWKSCSITVVSEFF